MFWKRKKQSSCPCNYANENPRVLELLLQVVQVIWKENYTESVSALSSLTNDENVSHTTKLKF